ncbi:alpha/beta hydrolase [Candidatus Saccharibacteria bacterium]|nr:alpha/beta hydrolase [Candidatus Saccharibacteria bacterium]
MSAQKELYIVHGWSTCLDYWQKTLKDLEEKRGIKVHMLNVPGLTGGEEKEYKMSDYVNWVSQQIPEGAIVLGHSNGGRILMNAIADGKLKPKRLILLNSAGIYYRSWKARVFMQGAKWLGWLIGKDSGLRKCIHRILRANDYANANEGMKRTLENMIESDRDLDFSKIKVPTDIIWGKQDKVTRLRMGKKLAELIPYAHLDVVSGWGHSPYFNQPIRLSAKIAEKVNNA